MNQSRTVLAATVVVALLVVVAVVFLIRSLFTVQSIPDDLNSGDRTSITVCPRVAVGHPNQCQRIAIRPGLRYRVTAPDVTRYW